MSPTSLPVQLEDLPNIGPRIAGDLRRLGINYPTMLVGRDPRATYRALAAVQGRRHDPCVLYTLMAVENFLATDTPKPWWQFVARGQAILQRV